MLFELEPDASITGGTFYADQEFDGEFAMLLGQQCEKYLQMKVKLKLIKSFFRINEVKSRIN